MIVQSKSLIEGIVKSPSKRCQFIMKENSSSTKFKAKKINKLSPRNWRPNFSTTLISWSLKRLQTVSCNIYRMMCLYLGRKKITFLLGYTSPSPTVVVNYYFNRKQIKTNLYLTETNNESRPWKMQCSLIFSSPNKDQLFNLPPSS